MTIVSCARVTRDDQDRQLPTQTATHTRDQRVVAMRVTIPTLTDRARQPRQIQRERHDDTEEHQRQRKTRRYAMSTVAGQIPDLATDTNIVSALSAPTPEGWEYGPSRDIPPAWRSHAATRKLTVHVVDYFPGNTISASFVAWLRTAIPSLTVVYDQATTADHPVPPQVYTWLYSAHPIVVGDSCSHTVCAGAIADGRLVWLHCGTCAGALLALR
jgi:hypothetical protein